MNNENNQSMILLFGMPRSGTTWIGKVFDSHPDVAYFHEPDSFNRIDDIPLFVEQLSEQKYQDIIEEFIHAIPDIVDAKVMAKMPIFNKNYLNPLQSILFKTGVLAAKVLKNKNLYYVPDYTGNTNVKFVWKSIESLGRLNFILNKYPRSKGVQIVRHPCGQIASVLKGESKSKFTGDYRSSEDYELFTLMLNSATAKKYELSLDVLRNMEAIERLAWKWVMYNEDTYLSCKENNNYTVAVYEALCDNPKIEYQKLFEHCELSWSEQTEKFLLNSTTTNNNSYYSVYKDPRQAANKWKKYLNDDDVGKIMGVVSNSPLSELFNN